MSNKLEALLESVVDKKPADFAEIFEDIMVEKMRSAVDDYSVFVAENLFVNDEEEEELEEDESVEEEEQLDEISKKKLGQYVKKAAPDAAVSYTMGRDAGKEKYANPDSQERSRRLLNKARRRIYGISKATDRLTKEEEEQLDEISKKKLGKYINKANYKGGLADFKHGMEAGTKGTTGSRKKTAFGKESLKREKGIGLAVKKLTGDAKVQGK